VSGPLLLRAPAPVALLEPESLVFEEMSALGHRIADEAIGVDEALDPAFVRASDRATIMALAEYELFSRRARRTLRSGPYRRAMRLLRGFLTEEQRRSLRNSGGFVVEGSAGGFYRLAPRFNGGRVESVERRGSRYYMMQWFCIHPNERVPAPDQTLGHLLLLREDETAFLVTANVAGTAWRLRHDWRFSVRQRPIERLREERRAAERAEIRAGLERELGADLEAFQERFAERFAGDVPRVLGQAMDPETVSEARRLLREMGALPPLTRIEIEIVEGMNVA